MGNSRKLAELDVQLVQAEIKASIGAALADVAVDRGSAYPVISLELPRSYFTYPKIKGYDAPAVFTLVDYIDFRKEVMGANHINAITRMNVAVLIEDTTEDRLELKAWRYQAALDKVLDQTSLTSLTDNVKIVVVVKRATFSGIEQRQESAAEKMFRKEVNLECDIYHYENF